MSRCFPFPPPGYEKKAITEDIDLVKKEKRKEKRHKKDKKDKEKRKGKEKKDEKHKEKKDKHRDKKKDKEKGKNSNLDDKKADAQYYNGDDHNKKKDGSLGHKQPSVQFRNGEHKEHIQKKEETCKESCSFLDDKKHGQNGELPVRNRIKVEDNDNYKFVQELCRRIRDDEEGTCSRLDAQATLVQNAINGAKQKEKEKEKESDNKQKNKDREKQRQENDRTKEEKVKEKTKLKKVERDKNIYIKNSDAVASFNNLSTHSPNINIQRARSELKKRKDTETNGFSLETEPRPNKMARPASNILTENGRKIDFLQNLGLNISDKQGPSLGSFKVDNKEWRVNGVTKPHIAAANHIAGKPAPTKPPHSVPNNVATPPLSGLKKKPSARPPHPHPDAKYLNQILMVPKLDQWSRLDDQEWLFSGKENPCFKKTTRDDSLNKFKVWSEAKNLESINLCALPYVIPY